MKLLSVSLLLVLCSAVVTDCKPFELVSNIYSTVSDVVKAKLRIGSRLISNVPVLLPSFEEISEFGKQTILSYPLEAITAGIHTFCSAAVATNGTEPLFEPDLSRMNYVLMTDSGNYSYSLDHYEELWNSSFFSHQLNTVVLVTGWLTTINDANEAVDALYKAYRTRGTINFIVIDTASHLNTLYTWSSFNTNNLGESLGDGLAKLVQYVPVESIHLIGHSLGAHIVGAAGRRFQELKGFNLPRITGLDPANPCFNEGESLSGLSRGDADLVDVIHSNVRVLGKRDPIGDIDFYPNGLNSIQPGCYTIICSHSRAWEYYAESVYPGNERNFIGVKCNGLSALISGLCRRQKAVMGYAVSNNVRGNFFLRVNSDAPFGRKDVY
ncbi:vitellogenin-3-like [Topomyia yanbarensis]|uniref:vitellogenin-3-like n=1 Tax=Topomyia yanbarensis TaxID=2498891 RepID=UPI00273A7D91|nr:vitellogenin-3-like [Topomyia yanbarensis]